MATAPFTLLDFKQLIVESLKLEALSPEVITDDEPLLGGRLGLDSIDALELVVALERRLGVRIRIDELDATSFQSVIGMYRGLETQIASSRDGGR